MLLDNGNIVTAANFENASYGMTLCAETVAIAKASSDGQLARITEIAVIGGPRGAVGAGEAVTPCGRCRQIIKEVADITARDIPVHCAHAGGYDTHLLSELLPNAFGPIINVIALNLAYLVSGVVVIETLFNFPGLGRYMVEAVTNRDVPIVQACAMIFCSVYVLLNLAADILAIIANPRVRYPK